MSTPATDTCLCKAGSAARCFVLVAALIAVVGCGGGYTLNGRVIEGEYSRLQFVSADDPRLVEGPGIDGATIMVFRDPSSLGRKLAAQSDSDADGNFDCRIGHFGAGWLIEDWEVTIMRHGFANASMTRQMPRQDKNTRLLVVLARGASNPVPTRDQLLGDIDRFGNH